MPPKKRTSPEKDTKAKKKATPKGIYFGSRLKEEIAGLSLMALAVCLVLSIASHHPAEQSDEIWRLHEAGQLKNLLGLLGAYLSYFFIHFTFGVASIAIPVLIMAYGWLLLTHQPLGRIKAFAIYWMTMMVLVSVWFAIPSTLSGKEDWMLSGMIAGMLAYQLKQLAGGVGLLAIWITLTLLWLVLVTRISIADLIPVIRHWTSGVLRFVYESIEKYKSRFANKEKKQPVTDEISFGNNHEEKQEKPLIPEYLQPKPVPTSETIQESKEIPPKKEEVESVDRQKIQPTADVRKTVQTELTSLNSINDRYDTALIEDLKALEQITASIELPDIDLDQLRKNQIESAVSSAKPVSEPVIRLQEEETVNSEIPRVANEDIAAGEFEIKKVEIHAANLTDLAEMAFQEELANLNVETKPESRGSRVDDPEKRSLSSEQPEKKESAETFDPDHELPLSDSKHGNGKNAISPSEEKLGQEQPSVVKTSEKNTEPDYDAANQAARAKYRFPSVDLLDTTHEAEKLSEKDIAELDDKIHQIIRTLSEFGIDTKVVATEYGGPVVAIYQLELPSGLKISRITGLEDELALSMKVKSVRIVPVTAKGTIQVEIPKPKPSPVLIRSLFEDPSFKKVKQQFKLGLALGKDIDGKVHFEDLARMPHLLIAGTTGSGKSVGINSALTSLLYQFDPSEVKLVLIDPKKVELALYRKLRNHHLICLRNTAGELIEDVITKPENAKWILKALVDEMDQRYDLLAHANVRNIEDYNKRWQEESLPANGSFRYNKLEYIIVVIDELADLMMTAPKEVENSVTRLAQMARAVGIHLIVATQRPSVDVLTGLIKANFPARIAYQVRSKIDSRTILDMSGAELLLGKGDMLYLPPGQMPVRIQNAFTSTKETEQIVDYISRMPAFPRKDFIIREEPRENDQDGNATGEYDSLYNDALEIVVKYNQGSASLLQRRLSIGYARAARIIDQLERNGVVSAQDGAKARQVLITESDIPNHKI